MPKIKDVLRDLNPWWKEEFRIEYKQREIYNKIKKFISLPQIYLSLKSSFFHSRNFCSSKKLILSPLGFMNGNWSNCLTNSF